MLEIKKNIKTLIGDITIITVKRGLLDVQLLNYGAAIYKIDFDGKPMTFQPDALHDFLTAEFYYGKTIGRTAGRLIAPHYQIDDKQFDVKPFRGKETKLHGGAKGFSNRFFDFVNAIESDNHTEVLFQLMSPDGDEDYPGAMKLTVTYRIDDQGAIKIIYDAISDEDTLCNITNHTYFNLDGRDLVDDHYIAIDASNYIAVTEDIIPIGKKSVLNTPFDLRKITQLKKPLNQLAATPIGGFDHAWLFDKSLGEVTVQNASKTYQLNVQTSYPSVVIFSSNIPSPDIPNHYYNKGIRKSFTLECQYEPSGIHYKGFNHAILRKNQPYHHFITYQFQKI